MWLKERIFFYFVRFNSFRVVHFNQSNTEGWSGKSAQEEHKRGTGHLGGLELLESVVGDRV